MVFIMTFAPFAPRKQDDEPNFLEKAGNWFRSKAEALLPSNKMTMTAEEPRFRSVGPTEHQGIKPQAVLDRQASPEFAVRQEANQPQFRPSPSPTPTPQPEFASTKSDLARNPAVKKFNIRPEVDTAIKQAASEFKLPPSILYDIALQESSFDPGLKNTSPEGVAAGTPVGLFQFTPGTWQSVINYANKPGSSLRLPQNPKREDPLTNARAAAYLISHGQLGRWDASKNIWGKFYSPEELQPYYSQTIGRK